VKENVCLECAALAVPSDLFLLARLAAWGSMVARFVELVAEHREKEECASCTRFAVLCATRGEPPS
jgi:hypothetical protein